VAYRPEGAAQDSPGQRPGDTDEPQNRRPEWAEPSVTDRRPTILFRPRPFRAKTLGRRIDSQGDALGCPLPPLL
jgi:hypothetical protein